MSEIKDVKESVDLFSQDKIDEFLKVVKDTLNYRLIKNEIGISEYDKYLTLANTIFQQMVDRFLKTQEKYKQVKPKRVFYISMEFLIGRALTNALLCTGLCDIAREACKQIGEDYDKLIEEELDAGLGNGGLGRLAACFMDSMTNLGIPCHGYGLNYKYGMFTQKVENGKQVEVADNWSDFPYPWAIDRYQHKYRVKFWGNVRENYGKSYWENAEDVYAVANDILIPGFKNKNVNVLRLWNAKATQEFNLDYFSGGDYMSACEHQVKTENITKVLYPNDNVFEGKLLRLQQEYFLVCASIKDIVNRYIVEFGEDKLFQMHDFVAIQLNDTHPALAVAELMRLLVDKHDMDWDVAWNVTKNTFAYTNHTLLPEALEQWPVEAIEKLLPRHLEIIYKINYYFLRDVSLKYPGNVDKMKNMSIINEDGLKTVRMANLAVIGSHKVNGVAALHSDLVKNLLFKDFYEYDPEKFVNVTNGVTPRRWVFSANKDMTKLITDYIGEEWKFDFSKIASIEKYVNDDEFINKWIEVKQINKVNFAKYIKDTENIIINPNTLFDVQVKRIHEYKRQLLLTLFAIDRALKIKANPNKDFVPRTIMIGGKAAPGYWKAKQIIYFINKVSEMINADKEIGDKLKVYFLPNYRVTLAEKIMPAADLSEQISTAGYEASGTGNMKMTLNGALTIGTLDGANVEIRDCVGDENIFIFGKTCDEVLNLKANNYDPKEYILGNDDLKRVLNLIDIDFFCQGEPDDFAHISKELSNKDNFMLMADFDSYVKTQEAVDELYKNPKEWAKKSILNVARSSYFSSDRSIEDYNRLIWGAKSVSINED